MHKAKTYIKGCIVASALALLQGIYFSYISRDENYVLLAMLAGSALTCSIVVWRELRKQED